MSYSKKLSLTGVHSYPTGQQASEAHSTYIDADQPLYQLSGDLSEI